MAKEKDGYLLTPSDPKYRKPPTKKQPTQIEVTTPVETQPKVKKPKAPKKPNFLRRYFDYLVEVITQ